VKAMRVSAEDAAVQRSGSLVLFNIARGGAVATQAVVKAGGPAAIVAAMERHADNADVQIVGCAALLNVAQGDTTGTQAVVASGGPMVMVAAMERHTGDTTVLINGLWALWRIAQGDTEAKRAVVAAGGLKTLASVRALPPVLRDQLPFYDTVRALEAVCLAQSPSSPAAVQQLLHSQQGQQLQEQQQQLRIASGDSCSLMVSWTNGVQRTFPPAY